MMRQKTAREEAAATAVREAVLARDHKALDAAFAEEHEAIGEALGFAWADWDYQAQLTAPSTRRLELCFGRPGSWHPDPHVPTPRLSLVAAIVRDTHVDQLQFSDDGLFLPGRGLKYRPEILEAFKSAGALRYRFGTWARYRAEATAAKAVIAAAGWTLTADERTLMDALEAYGQQAPARVRVAA